MATESTALLLGYEQINTIKEPKFTNGNGYVNGNVNVNGYVSGEHQQHSKTSNGTNGHIVHICKETRPAYAPIFGVDDWTGGLTLEELLPYVTDEWWQKFRSVLFCTFWVIFALVLLAACGLAIMQHDMPCKALNLVQESTTTINEVTSKSSVIAP